MGEVIYFVSPLQAFMGSFATVAFLFLLGVVGLAMGILRRREKPLVRFVMGGLGVFLIVAGATLGFVAIRSMTGGSQTFTAQLSNKQIANDNCGNDSSNSTCTRYILETQSGSKLYDLDVTKETYEKAQVKSCYSVTYYPSHGLFGKPVYLNSYESVSNISQIESVACQ
jgi:amino acid transporter